MTDMVTRVLSPLQQQFCSLGTHSNFVSGGMVDPRKQELLKARDWLREEWDKRGPRLSGRMIASAAQVFANRAGDPVKIVQQQINAIRNATEDKGPAKVPLWWRHVEAAFNSGGIDELLNEKAGPVPTVALPAEGEFSITDSHGRVVGKVIFFGRG